MTGAPGRPFRLTIQTQRESDLQRACLQYLSACRLPAWRSNVVSQVVEDAGQPRRFIRGLPKGFADISAIIPPIGRAAFVEVKAFKGRLSPAQVAWQDRMRQAGALVLTVKSLDDLRRGLRDAGVAAL